MSPALSGLVYLWWRTLVNVVIYRISRLRQPKYLVGALVGLAYFYGIFVLPYQVGREDRARNSLYQPDFASLVPLYGGMLLVLLMLINWLWRRQRSALAFTEADIAFLFPAPVPHHMLVHFSLVRGLLAQGAGALVFSLLMYFAKNGETPYLVGFLSLWLVLAVVTLHGQATGFTLTRVHDAGLAQWQRQLGVLAVAGLVLGLINLLDPGVRLPAPTESSNTAALAVYIRRQLSDGVLAWLFLPFHTLLQLLVRPNLPTGLLALVILGFHYAWAFMTSIRNNEGAITKAEKLAAMREAVKQGNIHLAGHKKPLQRDPFRLAPGMRPELAFFWKNLLSTRSYLRPKVFVSIAAFMLALDWWVDAGDGGGIAFLLSSGVSIVCLSIGIVILMMGSMFAGQDLRRDLGNLEILKTFPLSGRQVVLGSMSAPILILSSVIWLCLLQFGLSLPAEDNLQWLTLEWRINIFLSAAILIPFIFATQFLVINGFMLLYPGWSQNMINKRGQGIEDMGQGILMLLGQVLLLTLSMLPAGLAGLFAWALFRFFLDTYAILLSALVAAGMMGFVVAMGINWLGEQFESLERIE